MRETGASSPGAARYHPPVRALPSLIALVLVSCTSAPRPPPAAARAFDPAPWLEDLSQLEDHLGRHYANLEWSLRHRRLDPAELDRATRAALSAARTERDALEALVRFISAFRDPHLSWSAPAVTTRYDLRLTTDGTVVLVKSAGAGACGLRPGDVVETIEGRPAIEQLAARLPLSGFQNPGLRLELALRTFTSSPFAPPSALRLTVTGAEGPRPCVLAPVPSPGGGPAAVAELTASTPAAAACEALGSSIKPGASSPFLFRPERHAAFTPLPVSDAELGAGVLRLASGRTLGWIRIPSFVEEDYPRACAAAWDAFRGRLPERCGEECRSDFRSRAWSPRLADAVAARLEALGAARVSGVVVDVTDNGGGNDWAGDVARLLSTETLTCPEVAEVREAAAVERARRDLADLAACEGPGLDGRMLEALRARKAWAEARRAGASSPCDLSGVFRGGSAAVACSMLMRGRRALCDPPAPPSPQVNALPLPRGCTLFGGASDPPRRRGLVRVPLYVLINRRTASAAEQVASVLRDNGAATLVGERSLGAGCGYIDGGGEVQLRHSGLKVRTPNCARFRLDGTNETEGVEPDVTVPWAAADLREFDSYAEKVLARAGELFDRPAPRASDPQR